MASGSLGGRLIVLSYFEYATNLGAHHSQSTLQGLEWQMPRDSLPPVHLSSRCVVKVSRNWKSAVRLEGLLHALVFYHCWTRL